jgi:hypothetical protein
LTASRKASKRPATYSILAALTPLIPIPIVDDLVLAYLRRRLVRELAAAHIRALSAEDVAALANERVRYFSGCLLYPLKLLFRKVFFFLEWKRAADVGAHTYAYAVLLDYSLAEDWCGRVGAATLRAAIDGVLDEVGTKVLGRAVRQALRGSKAALNSAVGLLRGAVRGLTRHATRADVERAVESVEMEQERQVEPIADHLQDVVAQLPEGYFDRMRALLAARLSI